MIKLSEINTLERCDKRYEYNKMGIVTSKGKSYYLSKAMKETIKHILFMDKKDFSIFFNQKYIYNYLDKILNDNLFNPLSKREYLEEMSMQIERYIGYLIDNNIEVIATDLIKDVELNGRKIIITADLILKHKPEVIEVVKLKRGEPKLSYGARTFENKPKNNIELYLLQILGKEMYPSNEIVSSYHYMTSKNEKKKGFLKDYNSKKGYNIISFPSSLGEEKTEEIKSRINTIIEKTQQKTFNKTSDTKECLMCSYNNVCNYKKAQEVDLEKIQEIKKAPKDFNLTDTQRKAIMGENGVFRINAGAGSGKTTVVALRVTELILDGCKPEDILLVTFTNKGAVEMREKISYWLKKEGIITNIKNFNIMTFNAWGDKVIKEKYKILGFTKPPQLIEKIEKYDILFELLKNEKKLEGFDYKNPIMNFRYAKGVVVELENLFNYFDSNNVQTSQDSLVVERVKNNNVEVFSIYKKYKKLLKEKNLIEYQDQMRLITILMEEFPEELDSYNYKHIVVDEFQDTDLTQLDIILFLSNQSKFKSLMIVGDDAQSIFGFRNTSQEYILNFHKYFEEVKDINMVENFRSTPEIVDLVNKINSFNKNKIEKKLVSGLQKGKHIPEYIIFKSIQDEYRYISDKIKELINEGNKAKDFAIIARTKSELFEMEKYLKKNDIPYIIDIPEPLLNNTNIHIANSFINFLENLEITQGMFEYLSAITDGFENMNRKEIKKKINDETKKIRENLGLTKMIGKEEEEKLAIFFNRLKEIKDDVFQKFLKELENKNLPFIQLKKYLNKFIEYEDGKALEKNDEKYEAVILTTAHTAKGKEFKIVFNTINKYKADKDNLEAVEEERRILFVSLTRAKEKLFITYTEPKTKKIVNKSQYSPSEDLEKSIKFCCVTKKPLNFSNSNLSALNF